MALALWNTVINWGRSPVVATRTLAADADVLSAAVVDPCSQWRLIEGISPCLRPSARVEASPNPRFAHAMVRLADRDALWITWILTPKQGTTDVDLVAQIEPRSVLVRVAMLLGGRRWLSHHLDRTLGVLSTLAHRAAEDLDDIERHAAITTMPLDSAAGTGRWDTIPRHGAA